MYIDPLRYPQPRSRHHTNPQFYLPLRELHVVPSQYPPAPQFVDWSSVFASAQPPSVLDIGCGWGKFLLDSAELHPSINMLGIELRQQAVEWINAVIEGEHMKNVHAMYYSVANDLPFIESGSISEVYYFFPIHGLRSVIQNAELLQRSFSPRYIGYFPRAAICI